MASAPVIESASPGADLPDEHKSIYKIFNKVYNSEEYKERRKDMDRWLRQYRAKLWKDELSEEDSRVQVNYIFSNIVALAPLLTDNKPIWNVIARDPQFQRLADVYSKALECLWDSQGWDEILAEVVTDALLWPVGLTKIFWNPDLESVEINVVDPRTFVIAPGYEDLWDAAWCGVKTTRPMSWIAANYPEKLNKVKPGRDDQQGGVLDIDWSKKNAFELEDENTTVYEIWLRDTETIDYMIEEKNEDGTFAGEEVKETKAKYTNGRMITMTRDCVLDDRESPFDHGKPPYVAWYDYKVPHSFWGMGEPVQIEELHIEYNNQLQVAVKHSRLTQDPNYTADTSTSLNMDNVRANIGIGGCVFPFNGNVNSGAQPIKPIDMGKMDRVVGTLLVELPQAIQKVSGITDLTQGMAAKKERQSASEVSIMIESSYTRVRQKVRNHEGSIKRNMELVISLMQQNTVTPKYFSYKKGEEDGDQRNFMLYSNTPEYNTEINTPEPITTEHPRTGEPVEESPEDYEKRKAEDPDYMAAIELAGKLGEEGKVHWQFDFIIDTNSTLPQDKQTRVNTLLRLAEINVSPDSIVDDEAVIGPSGLNLPDHTAILARKTKKRQEMMKAKQGPPPGAPPGMPPGGPRPVPVPRNPAEQATPPPQV